MSENIEERVVESAPVPASESLDAASQDAQLQPPADGNGAAEAELPRTGEAVGASAAAGAESGQPVEEGEPGAAAPGTADGEETSPPGETPSRVAEVAHTVVEALQSGVVEARERVADVVHTVSSVLRREPAEEAGQEGAQAAVTEAVEPAAVADAGALEDADAAGAPEAEGPGAPETAGVEGAPAGEEAAPEKRRRRRGPPKKDLEKLATLEAGQVLSGTVRSIQTYGAFVDIGMGTDGLVHISELKDGFVEKVEDVVQTGQTVEVRVKEVDQERGRISLTMRQEQRPPRTERKPAEQREPKEKRLRLRDLTEGQEVTGRVASIVDFGAFVDIGATTDGLVHISEMSEDRINRVSDMLEVGQEVKARVLQVDRKRNRISLTMREQVAPEMEEIDDEDTTADLPSAMEAAFARAAENRKKDKPQRRQERSQQAELDDIIRRTLNERRG